MPSFGQRLKIEREKRAITLEEISSSTKIGKRMLQALENEDFDHLPGGIFNKGFVRAYARHVGLDEEQAVADYLEASGDNVAPPPPDDRIVAEIAAAKARASHPNGPIPWGWLAATLLVIALTLSLWSWWNHKHEAGPPQPESSQRSVPPGSAAPSNLPHASSAPTQPVAQPTSGSYPEARPASASVKNVLATAAQTPSAAPSGAFTVVIVARDDSWLTITADGKTVFENTLAAESQHTIHGLKEVVIRAGNTGALDFLFNGKKLPAQGDFGEVRTLTFGASGLQPQ